MKKIAFIFTIAVIGILFVTCESSTYVEVSGDVSHPTYETKIKPIIRSQCYNCHSTNGTKSDTPFETYQQVADYAQTIVCRIEGTACGQMMPVNGQLPQVQIDMFKTWIAQGYAQ